MSQFSTYSGKTGQFTHYAEHLQFAYQALAERKKRTFQQLSIVAGLSILDAGCGIGMDTIQFGQLVGPTGTVIGIDLNKQAIAEAEKRAAEAGVGDWTHHRRADAAAIPFSDSSFDICHAERMFMHLSDPEPVLTEMIRVLKPGGRIALVDVDGATISIDFPDSALERRIIPCWNKLHKNPFAGRQLYRLLKQHGMQNLFIDVDVMTTHDFSFARFIMKSEDVEAAALAAGVVTQAEIDRFNRELEELTANGAFFGSFNNLTVIGQKP